MHPAIAAILPGETRPVRMLTCIPRVGGGVFLWPLKLPTDDRRESGLAASARKAAELAETKWVRMQSDIGRLRLRCLDLDTHPRPGLPEHQLPRSAAHCIRRRPADNREDHPVIRQLLGAA